MQSNRIFELRKTLEIIKADAVIINDPDNVFYLSGFTGYGDGTLLITSTEAFLLTDSRYDIQAHEEAPLYNVKMIRMPDSDEFVSLVKECRIKNLAFENCYVSYTFWKLLNDKLSFCNLVNLDDAVINQRMIKDESEVKIIKKACEIAGTAFLEMKHLIVPGVREVDVAAELELRMRKKGAIKPSFDTILASGYRAAMPHGAASEKVIMAGEPVTCDFGAFYKGYCSDMTRTVFAEGEADETLLKIYDIVKEAHDLAIVSFKPGMTGYDLDKIARDCIESYGYGKEFGHSLGHGIGTQVHEAPSVSKKGDIVLEKGMIFSVEPGIYIEGLGGVRIEDLALVTDTGLEVITIG